MDKSNDQHRAEAGKHLSQLGKRFFKFIEFDNDEELVLEIRKHPFGYFLIEVIGTLVSAVVAVAAILLATNLETIGLEEGSGTLKTAIIGIGFLLAIIGIALTMLGIYIYRSNVIFVTSDKLAQVLYTNIIDRKISQLSIGDVQDVTVSQKGIFARLFNYGTLVIETAGEQQNLNFTFVPHPYESAKAIVGSHEKNLKQYGN